jgi:hypothetical protein
MALTAFQKEKIIQALIAYYNSQWDGSDAQFATVFDINPAVWARLKKGEREKVVRDEKLATIGRMLDVHWKDNTPWQIVNTKVHTYITEQLAYCQQHSISRIYCDIADIGKTTAARQYKLRNKHAFYIDGSKHKSKQAFVRALAKAVGAAERGSLLKVIADTVYLLQALDKPLVIIDEAGDLSYEAFLELKGYWNALEGYCGWYMLGADGLAKKIDNNIRNQKVGYPELFRRFGSEYMNVMRKLNPVEQKLLYASMANMIATANLPAGSDAGGFVKARRISSLTRLKEDIEKEKRKAPPGLPQGEEV